MKHLKNHYRNLVFRPIYFQLSKACVLSCLASFVLLFLLPLIASFIDGRDLSSNLTFMYAIIIFTYYFVITAITYVPFEALILLLIHYTKIWPFIMYSRTLVLMATCLFIGLYSFLNKNKNLATEDILCLCSIIVIFVFLCLRYIFFQKFITYQKHFIGFYNGKTIDSKSDNVITIVLYFILISTSLVISFGVL